MRIAGKSSKELKEVIKELHAQNLLHKAKIKALMQRKSDIKPAVKIVRKQLTKTESMSEHRKRFIGKAYAKEFLKDKIKGSFNTSISDLSMITLVTSDFCTEFSLPMRQLGILLYASNYRSVRKKDLYDGRDIGSWYAQTIQSMMSKDLIMRVNDGMKKWVYFTNTVEGDRLVREYNRRVKEYLVQDDTEAEGIKCTAA